MYREDVPLHVLYSSGTTPTTTKETWTKLWSLKAIRPCGRDCVDYLARRLFVLDINGQCKCCVDVPQDSVCEHSGAHGHFRAAEAGWSSWHEPCPSRLDRAMFGTCREHTLQLQKALRIHHDATLEAQAAFLELKSWSTFVPCANQKIGTSVQARRHLLFAFAF